jgi:hypothetical protein
MLIDGKKFDLRMHLLAVGVEPQFYFAFRDGLVRMCTHDYEKPNRDNMKDIFMHISNTAVQKNSDTFDLDAESGSKRSYLDYMTKLRENDEEMYNTVMRNMDECFTQTMAACVPYIQAHCENHLEGPISEKQRATSFHVVGFDVLIDEDGKCWVVEINSFPGLGINIETAVDGQKHRHATEVKVKKPLVNTTIDMMLRFKAEGLSYLENFEDDEHIYKLFDSREVPIDTFDLMFRVFKQLAGPRYPQTISQAKLGELISKPAVNCAGLS